MQLGLSLSLVAQLRNSTSIYPAGGFNPALIVDFVNNLYTGAGASGLTNVLDHTRNGNATMTGDYGPELVTNGDFSDGSTGWTVSGSDSTHYVTFANSTARYVSDTTSPVLNLSQTVLEIGKTYEVVIKVLDYVSGGLKTDSFGSAIAIPTSVGVHRFTGTASSTTLVVQRSTTDVDITIDNISVREVPKIQWAPHNLLTYSEDFSNAAWDKVTTTVTSNAAVAPDGTQTADKVTVNSASQSFVRDFVSISNTKHSFGIYAKAGTTSSIQLYIIEQGVADGTADIDLSNGSVSNVSANWTEGVTATSVGDGWYYITGGRAFTTSASNHGAGVSATGQNGLDFYIWGAHLYRSDLGGMADVPASERAFTTATKYVSTTDAARYLPRVNHHAYNGSQWVNKGLFVESESRTNLVTYSEDLTDASWIKNSATISSNATTAPDGNVSADKIEEDNTTGHHRIEFAITAGNDKTLSFYAKAAERTEVRAWSFSSGNTSNVVYDLSDGTVREDSGGNLIAFYEVGNGWYRCAQKVDGANNARVVLGPADGAVLSQNAYAGTTGYGVYVWGAQLEEASTPSSYIPTSGATVTRPAESITIPAANLPWPNPVYVTGEELVTNGTFDTDTSGWTDASESGGSISWNASGYLDLNTGATNANEGWAYQGIATVAGSVYRLTLDKVSGSTVVQVGTTQKGAEIKNSGDSADDVDLMFVAQGTTTYINIRNFSNTSGTSSIDNISVKEINPLALSIQVKGEMTYADGDNVVEAMLYRQRITDNDRVTAYLQTNSTRTGQITFRQLSNGTSDETSGATDQYSPGINVPFNIASRHGSTFVNGAVDGVALTANTTPVALPDLENTDLELAYDFMGTISLFRIWANDLGDTGIEEATEPSTQATLFLSFDGSNNSYIDFEWSV